VASRLFIAGNILGNGGPWSPDFIASYGATLTPSVVDEVNYQWTQGVGDELTWLPAEDVRTAVREYIARSGVDFVKYASSAHAHFRFIALSADCQRAIVEEAHAAGLTAQACTLAPEPLKLAVEAGCDIIQHVNSTGQHAIPQGTIDRIVEQGVVGTILLYTQRHTDAVLADDSQPAHWRALVGNKATNVRNLLAAGATLAHATDGGVFGPSAATSPALSSSFVHPDPPLLLGTSHVYWHRAMIEQGMSPLDALVASTRNVAAAYGLLDDVGTLEPGKRADLLVLDADPLADPEHYARIAHVVKDGVLVDRDRLPERPVLTASGR
jgi:imidazolonepropionase-like amidohydrolase